MYLEGFVQTFDRSHVRRTLSITESEKIWHKRAELSIEFFGSRGSNIQFCLLDSDLSPQFEDGNRFGNLNDTVDHSDNSIEGNLFAQKNSSEKQHKLLHPFILGQSRRKIAFTFALSKPNNKEANLDGNLRIIMAKLWHDRVQILTGVRRGIAQKKVGNGENFTSMQWLKTQASEGECLNLTEEKVVVLQYQSPSPWSNQPSQCLTCLTAPTRITVSPSPTVVYTRCEAEVNKLVQILESPLGFDLEWRVLWNFGAQERRTALVQLCRPNETIHKQRVVSLAKMTAVYLKRNSAKSKERTHLLMVHLKLLDLAKAGNKELDPTKCTSSVGPPSLRAGSTKFMRAYDLWHHRNTPLDEMWDIWSTCGRVKPLKESTVILNKSYVTGAMTDTSLLFDMSKLLELVKM
ncbi:hypothetical protein BDR04DRAFT_1140954 [Suillus decipiens]|nr:hypothetical protein BDR04DRAFT_1140954 [Suillus decipiens]